MKQYEIYASGNYIGSIWATRTEDTTTGGGEHRSFYDGDRLVATIWLDAVETVEKPWGVPEEEC